MPKTLPSLFLSSLMLAACYGTSGSDDDGGGASSGGSSSGASSSGASSSGGSTSGGSTSGGSTSGGSTHSGGAPPWETWQACSLDEDCIVIPLNTCCGCVPTGVNEDYEGDANAAAASFDASQCPPGLGCPSMPCPPDSIVACEGGVCVPKAGCSERAEQDCESDDQCGAYQARLCTSSDAFAYFACGKPKTACSEAETCGVSPFGQEVLFPDGCMPDGYTQTCVSQCQ
jgi:hypothetical protein